ncbi:Tetratricopeptide repeat-containing protein [Chitinophaga jiangningensis]|uniref:Tetratricopeptide repeat-containing protein n=1 Tax=Chitinophaga jiangningensis TaxID=1419482 RepID=A0A1M7KWV3_9BACT|nr:tetratricopeptide repeat protein [Chitinophaga jiangningensis]SHM69869.1 Tetratricopeptide repeat-containing protein [Chitinophaga jiangningensis]
MRKLTILAIGLAIVACNQQQAHNSQQQEPAVDSVLNADIIQPVTDSLQQFPDNHALYYRRALLLFNTHPELALKDFQQAAKLDATNTDYWAGAGEAALVTGNNKLATELFTKALTTAPGYPYLQYKLAIAHVEEKQYAAADSLADLLTQSKDARDQAFYLKARIAEDHQDTTRAIQYLRQGVEVAARPEYEALMELGDLLSSRRDAAAISYYVQAWKLDSANAVPMYNAGQLYEQLQQTDAAISAYRKSIVADPGYEAAYMALAHISRKQNNWKDAFTFYNLAAKAAPTDAEAYYYRAMSNEKLGKKELALEDYIKASSFRKDYGEAKEGIKRLSK